MKGKGIFVVISLLLFLNNSILAQSELKKQGDIYFHAGKYKEALNAYKEYNKTGTDPQLLIKRGLCYLYTNQPDACIIDMSLAHKLKSIDNKRFKYSAMAYFAKREYNEAAKFYKTYLNSIKSGTEEWRITINEIKRCGYSKNYKFLPQTAFIENLGSKVNTEFDEFGPVQSPTNPGRYYFSSARNGTTGGLRDKKGLSDVLRGHYSVDMFLVDLKDGNWSTVLPFEQLLNTPKHEVLQDFSQDGSIIYFVRSNDLKKGILYSDTFNIDRDPAKFPFPADLPFKSERGDKDLFIFNDSLIIFAAELESGYGGYDIYYAEKTGEQWQTPVNLGNGINSEANEISPFLIKSGEILYFSSDRTETFGGYDIFFTAFTSKTGWKEAQNIGPPINSSGNDVDMELSFDGMSAIFTSDRVESMGGKDLYIAYFKDQVVGQLAYTETPEFVEFKRSGASETNTKIFLQDNQNDIPLVVTDFISKPLYFTKNEDVLSPTNITQIKKTAELMIVFPDIKILLSSHFISEGRKEFDLYFSLKRAEKVAEQFIRSGISPHRIYLQGCGAGFPIAMPFINGIPSSLADKTNRRIDIDILSDTTENLKVIYDRPTVAVQYRDTLWDEFIEKNKGVTFRVLFSSVYQMLSNDVLGWRNDVIIEKKASEEKYSYTIGNFLKYQESKTIKDQLHFYEFYDAKIIPYFKGIPLEKENYLKMANEYPELDIYLKSEGE